jgi:hypothetical protein
MSTTSNLHVGDLLPGTVRLLSTFILIFLVSCTPNAPYRDLNAQHDPSTFGGYIGREPQQKSFTGGPIRTLTAIIRAV